MYFKYDWLDVNNHKTGVKVDDYGFNLVNTIRFLLSNEAYVLTPEVQKYFMWTTCYRRIGMLL